jgi:flagellar biosynthesis GTPase FlhF
MAGDWIKLQKDTPDKPEVLAIASRMNLDPDAVVGKLVRIWSWFDTHTVDGNALSVTFSLLDRLAGVTGFAEQMTFVGWLNQEGHVLTLPNFEYHNGETAKKRALGKNRQNKHRSNDESNANSNASSVTNALPEKRREEKSIKDKKEKATIVACPLDVDQQVWDDWKQLRKAKNAPVTETVVNSARKEASKANMTFKDFLIVWCARGSQGLQADWLKPDERNLSKTGQMNQRVISGLTRGLIGGGSNVKLLGE